jgi:PAS domain S-box-containing protein
LETVRDHHPDLPLILFTGKGSEEVASEAISAGVTDYLRKEGGSEEYAVLARQVRSAVEHRRAVERFEGVLGSAPDAITIIDAEGTVTKVHEQAEALFGYDRQELIGDPIERLIPERYREDHVTHRERYMDAPETRPMGADLDLYGLHAAGSEFPVDISLSPIEIGDHVEVMAAVRDISTRKWREEELREREQRLQRQNERLDEFASVVSHDLNNFLTAANGALPLTRDTGELSHLDRVEHALDRMETLVGDLLTLAREGQTVEDLEPVALTELARETCRTVRTADAQLELEDAAIDVLADEGRLKQVLENLFHNAIQHGDDVTVRVGVDDGVYVADDGPGIPPDDRDEVFDYGYSTREEATATASPSSGASSRPMGGRSRRARAHRAEPGSTSAAFRSPTDPGYGALDRRLRCRQRFLCGRRDPDKDVEATIETATPVVAMVHRPPLPGGSRYDGDLVAVLDRALADAQALSTGGVDGVLVENYGDAPCSTPSACERTWTPSTRSGSPGRIRRRRRPVARGRDGPRRPRRRGPTGHHGPGTSPDAYRSPGPPIR